MYLKSVKMKILLTNSPWHALHTLKIITLSQNGFHLFLFIPDVSLFVLHIGHTAHTRLRNIGELRCYACCFFCRHTLKHISLQSIEMFKTVFFSPLFKVCHIVFLNLTITSSISSDNMKWIDGHSSEQSQFSACM